ncbi:MAG: LolA-related protein [Burkholderiaceae bacterium]
MQGPLARAAGAFDLDALLSMIGKVGPSRATFDERKFLQQFDAPIDSSGELLFQPPATLVMRTLRPKVESMRVDGQTLYLERGRLQRTLQLAEHPEIAVFIEPIRAALAGDRAALERGYVTKLQGEAAQWKLQLTPRADAAGAAPIAVKSLLLSGRQGQVRQVEVRLADGDYSVMNIEPAAAQ